MKTYALLILIAQMVFFKANAQQITGPIRIHENQRYFTDSDGQPFFWMADTAWELFHRLDLEEAEIYLDKRASQGFNVVQAVALAEIDGLNTPNANGHKPFLDPSFTTPNERYFEHVDQIIAMAEDRAIHIGLLPTWGDKLFKAGWGTGPEIFTPEKAYAFGKWIGERYADRKNLIWIIGGDRNPREGSKDVEVWNEMARGITETQNPANKQLMTFHPQPTEPGGSSNWFHQKDWLDFNMHQTGHCPNQPTYQKIAHDRSLTPNKPTLDGEPMYEEHPKCFNAKELGYSEAVDIRRIMYWNVFAGAAGQSYGCHAVWQMYDLDKEGINGPLKPWYRSLDLEVANQVKHLKNMILSKPFFDRIPDQSLVAKMQVEDDTYIAATRDRTGTYAMIYLPAGGETLLNLKILSGSKLSGTWYDPRTGVSFPMNEKLEKSKPIPISSPSTGRGNDWVLIINSFN